MNLCGDEFVKKVLEMNFLLNVILVPVASYKPDTPDSEYDLLVV